MNIKNTINIKICGMKNAENIRAIAKLQPDYVGFIFYEKSSRFVGHHFPVENINNLPLNIKKVAVFVNEKNDIVTEIYEQYQFDYLQLHGNESVKYCEALKAKNIKIIKAFSIDESFDFSILKAYETSCDLFVFDTKGTHYGGNGVSFDWHILEKYKGNIPFLLSGGIGLHNVAEALAFEHKKMIGYDLNSKLEISPALKSIEITKNIIETIHNYAKTNISDR